MQYNLAPPLIDDLCTPPLNFHGFKGHQLIYTCEGEHIQCTSSIRMHMLVGMSSSCRCCWCAWLIVQLQVLKVCTDILMEMYTYNNVKLCTAFDQRGIIYALVASFTALPPGSVHFYEWTLVGGGGEPGNEAMHRQARRRLHTIVFILSLKVHEPKNVSKLIRVSGNGDKKWKNSQLCTLLLSTHWNVGFSSACS